MSQPKGIPNASGCGCWFASITQLLISQEDVVKKMESFRPSSQVTQLLKDYFSGIAKGIDVNNKELLYSLVRENEKLFKIGDTGGETMRGFDSFIYHFATELGIERRDISDLDSSCSNIYTDYSLFISPLSKFLFKLYDKNGKIQQIANCLIISSTNKSLEEQIAEISNIQLFPEYLLLSMGSLYETFNDEMLLFNPKDLQYTKNTGVNTVRFLKYVLAGFIVYRGSNSDHAIAYINVKHSRYQKLDKEWLEFDDNNVTPVEKPIFHKDKWAKVAFYKKVKV